jgi:hypothetical protein
MFGAADGASARNERPRYGWISAISHENERVLMWMGGGLKSTRRAPNAPVLFAQTATARCMYGMRWNLNALAPEPWPPLALRERM